MEVARRGEKTFIRRTRHWRAGCTQPWPSGSGGGGWIPLVTGGWPPTSSLGIAHGLRHRDCAVVWLPPKASQTIILTRKLGIFHPPRNYFAESGTGLRGRT